MKTQTQLHLLSALRRKRAIDKGFTLIELMIVVSIIGILTALALPTFLAQRRAAEAGARIGEMIGFAKECAANAAADLSGDLTPTTNSAVTRNITAGTNCSDGGTLQVTFQSGVQGVRCVNATNAVAGNTKATITVGVDGATTCAFS